jgi:hypothetical protein
MLVMDIVNALKKSPSNLTQQIDAFPNRNEPNKPDGIPSFFLCVVNHKTFIETKQRR